MRFMYGENQRGVAAQDFNEFNVSFCISRAFLLFVLYDDAKLFVALAKCLNVTVRCLFFALLALLNE